MQTRYLVYRNDGSKPARFGRRSPAMRHFLEIAKADEEAAIFEYNDCRLWLVGVYADDDFAEWARDHAQGVFLP